MRGERISGAIAAAATPLRDGGKQLDEDAFGPLLEFYAASGIDGILVLGTTGEGILLDAGERRARCGARDRRRAIAQVVVHAGAQSTADTIALAAHAAQAGAAGVAVIAPPYFAFDPSARSRRTSPLRPAPARRCRSTSTSSRSQRLRGAAGGYRGAAPAGLQPGRDEGLRQALGARRAVSGIGAGRFRRCRGLVRGDFRPVPRERSRARRRIPGDRGGTRARADGRTRAARRIAARDALRAAVSGRGEGGPPDARRPQSSPTFVLRCDRCRWGSRTVCGANSNISSALIDCSWPRVQATAKKLVRPVRRRYSSAITRSVFQGAFRGVQ